MTWSIHVMGHKEDKIKIVCTMTMRLGGCKDMGYGSEMKGKDASFFVTSEGIRDVSLVRALASHQCVPGSISGPSDICGLSLLLALYYACFSPVFSRTLSFPLFLKTNISKFQFDP